MEEQLKIIRKLKDLGAERIVIAADGSLDVTFATDRVGRNKKPETEALPVTQAPQLSPQDLAKQYEETLYLSAY